MRPTGSAAEGEPARDLARLPDDLDEHPKAHRPGDPEAAEERGARSYTAIGNLCVPAAGMELDDFAPHGVGSLVETDFDQGVVLCRREGDDHLVSCLDLDRSLHRQHAAGAAWLEPTARLVSQALGAEECHRPRDDAGAPWGEAIPPARNHLEPRIAVDDRRVSTARALTRWMRNA